MISDNSKVSPRRRWVAVLLSLPAGGGLGQIYVGRPILGLALLTASSLAAAPLAIFGAWPSFLLTSGLLLIAAIILLSSLLHAFIVAGREKTYQPRWYNRWYIYTALIGAAFAFQFTFILDQDGHIRGVRSFHVPSSSMEHTLKVGDYFYAATSDEAKRPRRGSIIVYRPASHPDIDYVKRVIGLPGDTVEVKANRAIVNGEPLDEPYVFVDRALPANLQGSAAADMAPVKIPHGMLFVMGDNRANSLDSRYSNHGLVPIANVVGMATDIFFARDWRRIGHHLNPEPSAEK